MRCHAQLGAIGYEQELLQSLDESIMLGVIEENLAPKIKRICLQGGFASSRVELNLSNCQITSDNLGNLKHLRFLKKLRLDHT